MVIDSFFKLLPIAIVHFGAIAWLLLDRQSILPTIAFVICLMATWVLEVFSLDEAMQRAAFPKFAREAIFGAYAIAWLLQLAGGFLFYWLMRVHTLPAAFEIMASSVVVTAVFYSIRKCFTSRRSSSANAGGPPFPWWEIGAAGSTVTPSAVLLAIIACKGFGLF
jgi:hypothetical protein